MNQADYLKQCLVYCRLRFWYYLDYALLGVAIFSVGNWLLGDIAESFTLWSAIRIVLGLALGASAIETLFIAVLIEDPMTTLRKAFGEIRRYPHTGKNPNNPQ